MRSSEMRSGIPTWDSIVRHGVDNVAITMSARNLLMPEFDWLRPSYAPSSVQLYKDNGDGTITFLVVLVSPSTSEGNVRQ